MKKSFTILFSFLIMACGSKQAVIAIKFSQYDQIRAYRYFDCCGCHALFIHSKISENVEYEYWVHCNCGTGIEKKVTTYLDNKSQKIEKYNSSKEKNLSLDSIDMVNFKRIDPILDLNFGCFGLRDSINSITGFIKQKEFITSREKSIFRKKVKI